jgi:enediyne biosynthesis protein E4
MACSGCLRNRRAGQSLLLALTIRLSVALVASCAICALVFIGAGCGNPFSVSKASAPQTISPTKVDPEFTWFEDKTDELGVQFVHDAGKTGKYFMPEIVGSGVAAFDYDNDGLLDLYFLTNGGPDSPATNRLFHQGQDGKFTDVSKGSGLDIPGRNMGVAIGDVNNDGWPDVLVTQYGGIKLFLNNGDGTFSDVTKDAGLDNLFWGSSAAFVDYDRDGWLDLVVVNYVNYDPARWCAGPSSTRDYCGPMAFDPVAARLFHNLGRVPGAKPGAVRFKDVSQESGLASRPGPGLGVFCADFNGDHWPDIFIANDGKANHLWINQRDGTFKEEGAQRGIAYNCQGRPEANMGIAIGDVDGDGLFDLFVTHLTTETHTLWKQGPRGLFQDRTAAAGLTAPRWRSTGFGTALGDFNNDGALDLAIVNGKVRREQGVVAPPGEAIDPFWSVYFDRNQLFINDGKGSFRDISEDNPSLCGTGRVGRGLAVASLNNDGALDLIVTNTASRARVYRNVAPQRGHWLLVKAIDPSLHRDAYGAEVTVRAGGQTWMRWINPGYSYLSSNDPRAHFGLGKAGMVDLIEVVWPDGSEEIFPGMEADRLVVLRKGEGKAKAPKP